MGLHSILTFCLEVFRWLKVEIPRLHDAMLTSEVRAASNTKINKKNLKKKIQWFFDYVSIFLHPLTHNVSKLKHLASSTHPLFWFLNIWMVPRVLCLQGVKIHFHLETSTLKLRTGSQIKVEFYNISPVYSSQLYGCNEPKILDQKFWTVPHISSTTYKGSATHVAFSEYMNFTALYHNKLK